VALVYLDKDAFRDKLFSAIIQMLQAITFSYAVKTFCVMGHYRRTCNNGRSAIGPLHSQVLVSHGSFVFGAATATSGQRTKRAVQDHFRLAEA
jgi:hypothetical protein